jgi:hypothetical protein
MNVIRFVNNESNGTSASTSIDKDKSLKRDKKKYVSRSSGVNTIEKSTQTGRIDHQRHLSTIMQIVRNREEKILLNFHYYDHVPNWGCP